MTVRTRFAPSPTGFLHLGSARTALYNWLYARKHQGQFILRIEDTDTERSTKESIDAILQAMQWLGLTYDEGPFYQMQRLNHYQSIADQLIKANKAYRCYCTKERLEQVRKQQLAKKQKPRYDGYCRGHKPNNANVPFVVRFRNPEEGQVHFTDAIHGKITVNNSELDDVILLRSDNVPTYNFSVIVDDLEMNITHVIRGDDHINNTPRQINIIKALGGNVPIYAHASTILGPDGKRLSKRHGAMNVMQYQIKGYVPQALLNYLLRLGWSHGDQEFFSLDEMITLFDLADINKAAAAFNPEKLLWLNQQYIKSSSIADLVTPTQWQFEQLQINTNQGPKLADVIAAQQERAKTLKEIAEKSVYFYKEVKEYDEKAARKNLTPSTKSILEKILQSLSQLDRWEKEDIHQVVIHTAEELGLKLGKVAQPIRVAITGGTVSPPIDITLQLLGKKNILQRLNRAIAAIP